ncbi:apolipoprotein N-acyltransferase [Eilatimonas milleporae]|uniref:Apolipoprotein N-acyltransferase n=1 Tax=Eilatimonas milleporae TaxID=911205 RepID=A0A3M0CHX8_9PROT|nr:apolipoprotein N-acyltransferase [Eilatimonas milleporae]RMB02843.1 apolipoprotein N-acyltransferase [Eilatimonas milleporae]
MSPPAVDPVQTTSLASLMDRLVARGGYVMVGFAFFLGIALSYSFAPYDVFILILLGVPAMVLMLDRATSPSQAFRWGWWLGFGFFLVGLSWVGVAFTQQSAVSPYLAPAAIVSLAGLLAFYTGLGFWLSRLLWCDSLWRIVIFAAIWTLFELARGVLFTGFPWHVLGSVWSNWLPMAQNAHWLTVYGLGFVTVLGAGLLTPLLSGRRDWRGLTAAVCAVLVAILMTGYGAWRLDRTETRFHLGMTMRLVQANVAQREKWIPYLIEDHFDKHLRLSRNGDPDGKATGVKLLIWPEASVQRETFDREGSIPRWRMSRLLEFGAFAITGGPRYEQMPGQLDYYNSLFAINARGDLYARYDKRRLVPFGEFLPFADLFHAMGVRHLATGASFSSGPRRAATVSLPGVPPFSPLICYEAIFPGTVADTENRPEWLLNVTNDGWFGLTKGPHQHLALARMRAIEEGLPMVRSASTGISAVIDPVGRTVTSLGLDRAGVLESPLPQSLPAPAVQTDTKILVIALLSILIIILPLKQLLMEKTINKNNQ